MPDKWEQALWKGYEDYEFLVTDRGYVKDMRKSSGEKEVLR